MFNNISRKKTVHEASFVDLSKSIQNYRQLRENLITLTINTFKQFHGVSNILSPDIIKCFDTESLANLLTELGMKQRINMRNLQDIKVEKLEIENPGIAVIGQTNAGKSIFINTLMKKAVMPQSFDRCTDRITRVSFSEKSFVEIVHENGDLFKRKTNPTHRVLEKCIRLNEENLRNPEEISKMVRIGIDNKFIQSGIDLIDFPGISENGSLCRLAEYLKKNAMPIVIYVIDGRPGVKQSDTADLLELKNLVPNLDILYFITHLDTDNDDEHVNTSDPIDLANVKMDISFRKLQDHNFIPKTFKNWFSCPYFHGAAMLCLAEHSKNKTSPEIMFSFKQFCKFHLALQNKISIYFENKILKSCDILMTFQMDISAKIINYANNFAMKTKENYEQIASITKLEAEMYSQIRYAISDSKGELILRLISRLEKESNAIIAPIIDTMYPSSIHIPEDGIVDDPAIVDQCNNSIIKVLIQGLENILKAFVEEELFLNYRKAVEEKFLHSISIDQSIQKTGKLPYKGILERILNRKYKLERMSITSSNGDQVIIVEFMNVVLSSIKTFLSNGLFNTLNENEVNVKNPEWKLQQATEYLSRCNHHLLAEEVCKGLFDDFEKKHQKFLKAMKSETKMIKKKILDSEHTRLEIAKNTPNFFISYLETQNIKDKYLFNNVEEKKMIGQGAQSVVYKCMVKNVEMAVKKIDLEIYTLENISEEIFYSRQLSHSNLLSASGISIADDGKKISIYYPLKKVDLRRYMNYHLISSKNLSKISLQVTDALSYLHNQGIVHKDLKLTNILIDENDDATISDYGFCKSEAMSKQKHERIPIHIAPEIRESNLFTKKSDIYAFGIILWHLFEGTGKIPRDSIYLESISQVVWARSPFQPNTQMIPENMKKIPAVIWTILENCWLLDPNNRPDIDQISSQLQSFYYLFNNVSSNL